MGWRPNMSQEARNKLNASRRRQYARRRLRTGKSYSPKDGLPINVKEPEPPLPTLSAEEAYAILQRIEKEEEDGK